MIDDSIQLADDTVKSDNGSCDLLPGTLLRGGSYRIISTLGRGGFGITYMAEHVQMQHKVCIKEFFLNGYHTRNDNDPRALLLTASFEPTATKYRDKFLREANILATLDHPNIVRVHDAFTENDTAYYVMDFIDGTTLNDVVLMQNGLSESMASIYIEQVALALQYLHSRYMLHLDVKPHNIMIRKSDGRAILIDFGLTKLYNEVDGAARSKIYGGYSSGYSSIEQSSGSAACSFTPETDIYSLGATLYNAITNTPPPLPQEIDYDKFPCPSKRFSESVRRTIRASMQYKVEDRPHSIDEFLAILHGKSRRRWRVAVALIATLLIIVAAGVGMFLLRTAPQETPAYQTEIDIDRLIADGNAYYENEEYDKAFEMFQRAAQAGDVRAQINVGACYQSGRGRPCNMDSVLYWYRKAALQDNVDAIMRLGDNYYDKSLPTFNVDSALFWYSRAASQGNAKAMFMAASCCDMLSQEEETVSWLQQAAARDYVDAQMQLAKYYLRNNDMDSALPWITKAAELGNVDAKHYLQEVKRSGR